MPYDITRARLVKENGRLRRELGGAKNVLPEGAGWCEECIYPGQVDGLQEQMGRERRKHNAHANSLEQSYQEISDDLDSCRAKAQKCQLKNRQLIKSTAGYFG